MLGRRLAAAATIIVPVLCLFWIDAQSSVGPSGIWLGSLALLVSVLACAEFIDLLRHNTVQPVAVPAYLGTILTVLAAAAPEIAIWANPDAAPVDRWGLAMLAGVSTLFCALLLEMLSFDPHRNSTTRIALTLLVVAYSGGLMSFLVATRMTHPGAWGVFAVFSILCIVKMGDAGAYFGGRAWGRRPMAPQLSPKKTVEGLMAGVAASCLTAWILFRFVAPLLFASPPVHWSLSIAYGASLSLVGVFGDLSESLFKRDMRCKDSSSLIPGLGGILDVVDSALVTAPVGFMWWSTGWLQP